MYETVNATHNIEAFKGEPSQGKPKGCIHVVDVSNVKDRLPLFTSNNPGREVIYNGEKPPPILEIIPHALFWDFKFCRENTEKYGFGAAEN